MFGQVCCLQLWQYDSLLCLVFAFPISVAGLADLIRLEEYDLAEALIRINPGGERRSVRDFESDKSLPLRLEGRHIHNDAAAGIGALADADREHAARNLEIFDRARQSE